MEIILILGALLNGFGAFTLLATTLREMQTQAAPDDYWQLRLFVAGTALTFGMLYLYLFWHPAYVWPFLVFGAALKSWAFLLSLFLFQRGLVSKKAFTEFGILNGVVAVGFWIYLFSL